MTDLDSCVLGFSLAATYGYILCTIMLYQIIADKDKSRMDYIVLFSWVIPVIILVTSSYAYLIYREVIT